jgi:hypothetical protein
MNEERLKYLGRRSELEVRKTEFALRIGRLASTLRDDVNPLKAIADLQADAIVLTALDLADACERHREVLAELKKIQNLLGT